MHCNLSPPEPRQLFAALITTPCQVWSRWTYPLPYNVFAADTLLYDVTSTSDPVTVTFDFEHLQRIACDVMKLCTKFERNRTIRGGVIAITVFDLMTWACFKCWVTFAITGIIFTKFDLGQLIHAWNIAFFDADTIHYIMLWPWPLTSWPWTFTTVRVSCV